MIKRLSHYTTLIAPQEIEKNEEGGGQGYRMLKFGLAHVTNLTLCR